MIMYKIELGKGMMNLLCDCIHMVPLTSARAPGWGLGYVKDTPHATSVSLSYLSISIIVLTDALLLQSQYLKMLGLTSLMQNGNISWSLIGGIILASTVFALVAGVAIHRWRTQHQMQSEIHAIM